MIKVNNLTKSLDDVHSTVDTLKHSSFWKKLFAFMGPAYLVSVGYMDPGNWATDIAGGSKFGYALIWVLLMSNIMALLLQSLSARLGLVRGLDLAQASREAYNPIINFFNWFLCEIAIAACDLAEVIGMAIGLQLLFDIPLLAGVSITVLDTIIILFLQRYGMRKMEAFILTLIATIGLAFLIEMVFAKPDGVELVKGFIPSIPNSEALYIAIGIIGATVMPHNLYLHSALVQTRKFDRTKNGIWSAIRYNFIDTAIALNMALFVNGAILILAASAFYNSGLRDVSEIQDAHRLLEGVLGTKLAPILFAVALIAAGQSSTLTGTLSGQIVMEGYLNLRIQPWLRRLITRVIAIVPAFLTIIYFGEDATGDLLVLSQVILSLQLGFAIIPLIHFTSDKRKMGEFVIKPWIKIAAWIVAAIIVSLNVNLVIETISIWIKNAEDPFFIYVFVLPVAIGAGILLLYVTFSPLFKGSPARERKIPHGEAKELSISEEMVLATDSKYNKIAITVDFSLADSNAVKEALGQGGRKAHYVLIHVVETAGALLMREDISDHETTADAKSLNHYAEQLRKIGVSVSVKLGYGNPKISIPDLVKEENADLLVMGAHGHGKLKDIAYGTTLEAVRHSLKIPVMIVRNQE
ncbi:MAG TPA: Nramp family divalent metal transporter [Bacteroidia bacterium]|nr:Nramp family divalent metal transporter [Bacteroidia bacterium]